MRKKFVAGNWKMNSNMQSANELAAAVVNGVGDDDRVTIAICPPFPYLASVAAVTNGSPVALGAQNLYHELEGAFTGEVSPRMLTDVGCQYVILGHSERRHVLGETNDTINRKVKIALETGLQVIFCIGEKLDERESNQTEQILDTQLQGGLSSLSIADMQKVVIAYEPVWAIGTGKTATPDQAQEAHAFVRKRIGEMFDAAAGENLIIQYGGSVKPDNANELLGQSDVDGALVGGASLKADLFLPIVRAGLPT